MSDTPNNQKPSGAGKYLDQATWEALKASGFTDEQLYADQPLGPIIFQYSRKQAIADGVLVDLTGPGFRRILAIRGIKVHAAMTATCFAAVVCAKLDQTTAWEALCRLDRVLHLFRGAVHPHPNTNRVDFAVPGVSGGTVAMYAHIGPGDEGEPVLTFMLEGED